MLNKSIQLLTWKVGKSGPVVAIRGISGLGARRVHANLQFNGFNVNQLMMLGRALMARSNFKKGNCLPIEKDAVDRPPFAFGWLFALIFGEVQIYWIAQFYNKLCSQLYYHNHNLINKMKDQQDNTYMPSRYSQAYNTYSRCELRSVIPILRSVARSCHIAFRFPVYKVLKAVAKIFLMNQIEAIFFAYMIKETSWDIKDKLITQNSEHVRDVVSISSDHPEYKNLILYLMLVTYSLKFFLNEKNEELLEEATKICPGFKSIFQNWAKKNSNLTKRINPKTLNKVYQDLYFRIRHEQPDFNLLVDSTLQISPAYNPQKSEKDRRMEKKQVKQEEPQKQLYPRENPSKMIKTEPNDYHHQLEQNPLFSSSRIYQMVAAGLNVSEGSNFQVFGQINKSLNIGTRFGNSVFGSSALIGVPSCPVKDEQDYCQQLHLGLQQGQSEQNINLRDDGPPPTSIINLSRVNSITERYLTLRGEGSQYRG